MLAEGLKREYWSMIRRTRLSGRVSPAVIQKTEEQWAGYDDEVVEEALRIHMARYKSEKECYTLGIMRNLQKHKDGEEGKGCRR